MSAIQPVSEIDRQTDLLLRFLENMPDMTECECHIAADLLGGADFPPHHEKPVVSDINSELQFCAAGWRAFVRGDWHARE